MQCKCVKRGSHYNRHTVCQSTTLLQCNYVASTWLVVMDDDKVRPAWKTKAQKLVRLSLEDS